MYSQSLCWLHKPACRSRYTAQYREEGRTQIQSHAAMVKLFSCCMKRLLHVWTVLACVDLDCASLHIAEIQGPDISEHQVLGFQFNPEHLRSLHSMWKELGALEWDVKYFLLITRNGKSQGCIQTTTLLYKLDAWVSNMKKIKPSTQELKPWYNCLCVSVFGKKKERSASWYTRTSKFGHTK